MFVIVIFITTLEGLNFMISQLVPKNNPPNFFKKMFGMFNWKSYITATFNYGEIQVSPIKST